MPDDGNYDDSCSCGSQCCNFMLNFYTKLGRFDLEIVPVVTSESVWEKTKSSMIFVLAKLMKLFAEFGTVTNVDYNKVHSVSGEMAGKIGLENCNRGPKKYS